MIYNNYIKPLKNDSLGDLRITHESGELFFCVADLAKMVGVRTFEVRKRLQPNQIIKVANGNKTLLFIDEDAVGKILSESRRAKAKEVADWVLEIIGGDEDEVVSSNYPLDQVESETPNQPNNPITPFFNEMFGNLRTIHNTGTDEIWFCLKDVCDALELSAKDVKCRLRANVVSTNLCPDSTGRNFPMLFVNEKGLYRTIMQSRKQSALDFQDWVMDEVLPQIRKTGGYIPVQEEDDDLTIMAKAVQISQRTIKQKDELICQQQKTIDEQDNTIKSLLPSDVMSVEEAAKYITNHCKYIGEIDLFRWLRENGYVMQDSCAPTAYASSNGWLKQYKNEWNRKSSFVTNKGLNYFLNRIWEEHRPASKSESLF